MFYFTKYINIQIFIISFLIGLCFIYVLGPEKKNIYIYPNLDNINKILFKDKTDSCFYFKPEEVDCTKNKSLIDKIPLQF
jgi:hypothetical protein